MLKSIRIHFQDGTFKDLVLSRATEVKTTNKMLNLDQLKDGTWRMIYDAETIPDMAKVMSLELVRDPPIVRINEFKGKRRGQEYYDDHECG